MTTVVSASTAADAALKTSAPEAYSRISDERDGDRFQSMLQQYIGQVQESSAPAASEHGKTGLSEKIVGRATEFASEMKKDQMNITRMLETAAATGDQMHLMKAMLALNDYQTRVQFVSKTIVKATSSLDTLTRMQ